MSGALFSRKFVYSVNSVTAYNAISEELANDEKSGQRLDRARARIGRSPNEMVGRDEFCTPEEAVWVRRRLARLEKARKLGEGMIDGHSRWEKRKRRRWHVNAFRLDEARSLLCVCAYVCACVCACACACVCVCIFLLYCDIFVAQEQAEYHF